MLVLQLGSVVIHCHSLGKCHFGSKQYTKLRSTTTYFIVRSTLLSSLTLTGNKSMLHIHVTVRRYRFLLNNQPDALIIQIYSVITLYMFRATSLPIIGRLLLYIRHW